MTRLRIITTQPRNNDIKAWHDGWNLNERPIRRASRAADDVAPPTAYNDTKSFSGWLKIEKRCHPQQLYAGSLDMHRTCTIVSMAIDLGQFNRCRQISIPLSGSLIFLASTRHVHRILKRQDREAFADHQFYFVQCAKLICALI